MDKYRLSIHVPPYQVGYSVAFFFVLIQVMAGGLLELEEVQ
jgi:hypothetical protein